MLLQSNEAMDTRASTARALAAANEPGESTSNTITNETTPNTNSLPDDNEDAARERRIEELTAVIEKHDQRQARRRVLVNLERQVQRIQSQREGDELETTTGLHPDDAVNRHQPQQEPRGRSRPREEDDGEGRDTAPKRQRSKEDRPAVPKPIFYSGGGRTALRNFTRICESIFEGQPEVYPSDKEKTKMGQDFLSGEVAGSWDRLRKAGETKEMTWKGFNDFLLDELSPAMMRGIDVGRKWNDAKQGPGQSVRSFVTYLDQLYDMLKSEQTESARCDKLLFGLRPEISDMMVERREGQNHDRTRLIESAILAEAALTSKRTSGATRGNNYLSRERPTPGGVRPDSGRNELRSSRPRQWPEDRPASGANRQAPDRPKPTCGYCGIVGHTTEACFKRKNAEKTNAEAPKGGPQ